MQIDTCHYTCPLVKASCTCMLPSIYTHVFLIYILWFLSILGVLSNVEKLDQKSIIYMLKTSHKVGAKSC